MQTINKFDQTWNKTVDSEKNLNKTYRFVHKTMPLGPWHCFCFVVIFYLCK